MRPRVAQRSLAVFPGASRGKDNLPKDLAIVLARALADVPRAPISRPQRIQLTKYLNEQRDLPRGSARRS